MRFERKEKRGENSKHSHPSVRPALSRDELTGKHSFRLIRARGGCSDEYSIRSFYAEHHRMEALLASLRKTANEYLEAVAVSSARLVGSFQDVVDFYPGHMWKADHILFPLADDLLLEMDQGVLVEQFAWIESAIGGNADEQLRAVAKELHPKTKVA